MSGVACLVTGATGFVGSALVERLARAGTLVHALARPSSRRAHLDSLPIVWHAGDVTDRAAVHRAVLAFAAAARESGARAELVHSAALISYRTTDRARSAEVNVEGTRHVLDAAREAGLARLCFVSSVVAVGAAPHATASNHEESPFVAAHLKSAYVHTKRAAEELALALRPPPEVVVVNPGAIFGPAVVPSNSARLLASLARRRLPIPVPPGSLSVVGLADVAAGIELALARGRPGRRYLLTESNWRIDELLALVLTAQAGRPWLVRTPRALFRAATGVARGIDAVRSFDLLTPDALELLAEHYRFDSARARSELGWAPRPFAEVVREMVASRSGARGPV